MKLTPFLERRARAIAIIAAAEAPLRARTFPGVRIKGTTNGSQGVTLDGRRLRRDQQRGLRDGVAKAIGIDDRSPTVEYVADDERGAVREYAVRFEVYPQVELCTGVREFAQSLPAEAPRSPRLSPNVVQPSR